MAKLILVILAMTFLVASAMAKKGGNKQPEAAPANLEPVATQTFGPVPYAGECAENYVDSTKYVLKGTAITEDPKMPNITTLSNLRDGLWCELPAMTCATLRVIYDAATLPDCQGGFSFNIEAVRHGQNHGHVKIKHVCAFRHNASDPAQCNCDASEFDVNSNNFFASTAGFLDPAAYSDPFTMAITVCNPNNPNNPGGDEQFSLNFDGVVCDPNFKTAPPTVGPAPLGGGAEVHGGAAQTRSSPTLVLAFLVAAFQMLF